MLAIKPQNNFPVINYPHTNNEFLKFFIKNLPTSVAIFDKNLNYLIASDKFFRDTGLCEITTIGHHIYSVVGDLPEKWKEAHARCLKGEHLKCDEDKFERGDGKVEWWKWEVTPWYYENNSVGGIILFVENITLQKELETDLKETINFLNESNKSLLKFSHLCAHDLSSPLRSIGNYGNFIKEYLKEKYPQEDDTLTTYLNKIIENASYMSALILKLVDYTSLKKRCIKKEWFLLEDTVKNIVSSLQAEIDIKKASIKLGYLPFIYADKVLITQLFQNLIANSLKYNDKPEVFISVDGEERENSWVLYVHDNGIGIAPQNHKKIFEESVQINASLLYGGSGIGLSQCKRIVKDHGGEIWVESELGKGATFFVTLKKDSSSR